MLIDLTINNIVLIEKLDLEFKQGLTAMTGETGAGKSILLDSLGLILGMRANSQLLRTGTEKASVIARFSLTDKNMNILKKLAEFDIDTEDGEIIIRRILAKDGKTRAFINDISVSVNFLKEITKDLVEIHGQFETQSLMQSKTHKNILDKYARNENILKDLENIWQNWQIAEEKLAKAKEKISKAKSDEDYLRHLCQELENLAPEKNEEEELRQKRDRLANLEKIKETIQISEHIIASDEGVEIKLGELRGVLERLSSNLELEALTNAISALERAEAEIAEFNFSINELTNSLYIDEEISLDMIEERLFALKDQARKHNCEIAELPEKLQELQESLKLIENQEDTILELEENVKIAKEKYLKLAEELSILRKKAGEKLAENLKKELPKLKLEKANFVVNIERIENSDEWAKDGIDKISFLVAMNPGQALAPLHKTASGGEQSRLMLALKVILAELDGANTIIFDEIDAGVGGAVADAVGEHLKNLSQKKQVLVVTHSPQLAAKADTHLFISKTQEEDTKTNVKELTQKAEKIEEIARMLSGQEITKEAKAAALKLIENKDKLSKVA